LRQALCPPDSRCFCQACRAPAKRAELEPVLYQGRVWFMHRACTAGYLARECAVAPELLHDDGDG